MTITFEILGKPQPRGSKRAFMRPGMKFPIITDDNTKSKPWMDSVRAAAKEEMDRRGLEVFDGPLILVVQFVFCRPKGHIGKKGVKASAPKHHTKRPDSTKLVRGLEDALSGLVWRDDSQVVEQRIRKSYGTHDHTVVWVRKLEEAEVAR